MAVTSSLVVHHITLSVERKTIAVPFHNGPAVSRPYRRRPGARVRQRWRSGEIPGSDDWKDRVRGSFARRKCFAYVFAYVSYIYVGAVAPPGASQRRLSTLQPKGSARHGVRPCAHHNSHSSKSIYDPSFQWPSWLKRRASFEPGYVTPNLEIPGLYWTAFKYARMSSIFEDLTPLLVTHVK